MFDKKARSTVDRDANYCTKWKIRWGEREYILLDYMYTNRYSISPKSPGISMPFSSHHFPAELSSGSPGHYTNDFPRLQKCPQVVSNILQCTISCY